MKTFKQFTEYDPNTIMIVDAINLSFRWRGKSTYKEEYISTIDSLRKSYKAGKVIIACDKGFSSYRKTIYPEYKANREELRSKQTEQEKLDFQAFFSEFSAALDILRESEYPVLQYQNVEADDIAAYIVNKRCKLNNIWLISSDRDWDLLVNDTVSRFSYVTRKEITKDNWNEHYDYDLDQHLSIKCLINDISDNIPGVEGIGPKRAQSLIEEYGDCYDVIASMPIPGKYKYIKSLNDFGKENLLRNYKLMDLVSYCEEAIGEENCKEIDKVLKEYLNV